MRETAVMSDAQKERPRRAFATKARQRQPYGSQDVLGQIVPLRTGSRVAGDNPPQSGSMFLEEVVERHLAYSLAPAANLTTARPRAGPRENCCPPDAHDLP